MSILDIGTLGGRIELDNRLEVALDQAEDHVKHFAETFFHEFESLTAGVKDAAIAVGGLSAAVVGLGATIVALGVSGSKINDVETGFNRLSGSTQNAKEILEAMQEGVKGTVNDLELMTNANRLLGSGVAASAATFGTMTAAANVLSREGYGTLESIMATISRAEQTGMLRRLAYIGITGNMKDAEETYARSIGLTFSALSQSQRVEAERFALQEALNKVVSDGGMQQLSFAQLVNQTSIALANWVEKLEKSIGTSTHVAEAFIAVRDALVKAFGGDSDHMLDTVVGWVNSFADAVKAYGPPIIAWVNDVRGVIGSVYHDVLAAWSAVPDWFKEVAKTALEASAAAWIASAGFHAMSNAIAELPRSILGGESKDLLSTGSEIAEITTLFPTATSAVKELGQALFVLKDPATSYVSILKSFGPAALAAATPFIELTAIIYGVKSVIDIGAEAWGLYADKKDRALSKTHQDTTDQNNIAVANDLASHSLDSVGRTFKTLDEATVFLNSHIKDQATGVVYLKEEWNKLHPALAVGVKLTQEEIEANKRAEKAADDHRAAVSAFSAPWHKAANETDLITDALKGMSQEELATVGGAEAVLKALEKWVDSGHTLNQQMKDQVQDSINLRINLEGLSIKRLEDQKVTLDQINADKAHGLTMAEIALKYGASASALAEYDGAKKQSRKLDDDLATGALKNSGDTLAASKLQIANDLRDKLAAIKETGEAYTELRNKQIALSKQASDALMIDSAATFKASQEGLKQVATRATDTYNSMTTDGKTFSATAKTQFKEIAAEAAAAFKGIDAETFKSSIEGLTLLADAARNKYEAMRSSGLGFTQDVLNDQRKKMEDASDAMHGLGSTSDAVFAQMKTRVSDTDFGFRSWLANTATASQKAELGFDSMGRKIADAGDKAGKSAAQIKQMADAAAAANRALGGTNSVTATNFADMFDNLVTSWVGSLPNRGLAGAGNRGGRAWSLAQRGYSFEEIARILQSGNLSDASLPPPAGPKIPGFALGGTVMVGENGPERVALPAGSTVYPNDPGVTGGGGHVITFHPGSIVMQYPVVRDRQAMDQLGSIAGDAIIQRLVAKGWRPPSGAVR